ncbi:unnamed protein product, partial [Laminaria digitata]
MYNRQMRAWMFLATALKSPSDKAIFHRCKSPREAWEKVKKWHEPGTVGAQAGYFKRLSNYKVESGADPVVALYALEDMANEMRDIGLTVEDPMLYTCCINALP